MTQQRSNIAVLAPLFLVLIIDTMGIGLIFPVLGPLFMSKGSAMLPSATSIPIRDILFGITTGIYCVGMFFGAPFLGDLSDHLGRKKVLLICLGGTGVGLLLSAIAIDINSVVLLIFSRMVAGFTAGSQSIAQAAIADISTEQNKAVNLSLMTFANCVGFVMGPLVSGILADRNLVGWFDFSTPFFMACLLAFANAFLLMMTFKETYFPSIKRRLRLTKGLIIFVEAFKHHRVRLLSVILLLTESGWSLYFWFMSVYLVQNYHYGPQQIGRFMAWMGIIFGVALIGVVRVAVKYVRLEKIIYVSEIIAGLGMLLLLINREWVVWFVVIPVAIFTALPWTALITLFSNSASKDEQGWVMGVTGSVVAVAWGAGAVFSGLLAVFAVYVPFIVASVLILLGGIIAYLRFSAAAPAKV